MMHQEDHAMAAFQDAVLRDSGLQDQLRQAQSAQDVADVAAAAGYNVRPEDVADVRAHATPELSEPELEAVAGALPCWCDPSVTDSKSCG